MTNGGDLRAYRACPITFRLVLYLEAFNILAINAVLHFISFPEFSDASTTFLCRVYYAEEFFRLRELLLPQGEVA